jgi:LacI family transcriptional regulator
VGFFAFQDTAAAEMISICLKNNLRVPENIAVLGVDNDDLVNKGLSVELSSVDSDQEGLGLTAAKTLQKLLDSNSTATSGSILRHPPKGVVSRLSTDSYAVANPLVANALHWIKNNFYNGIQATDVAEAMGVTQQGLQKAFANCYSKSPGQEIRYQRTHAVAHLLQTTDANLDEIAKNCGYYSVNSLINSFRAEHGTTPGSYRKCLKSALQG